MDIGTKSADRVVNVGSTSTFYSLFSTAKSLFGRHAKKVAVALAFLESGSCNAKDCAKAAKQLEKINKELGRHAPEDAVWDMNHPNILAPWDGNIAPTIESCADLYTTSEGEPMLPELIGILQYADATKQEIVALG